MIRRLASPRGLACLLAALIVVIIVILLATPKPWRASAPDSIVDFARIYLWWAALINLVPLAILAVTTRLWSRPLPQPLFQAPQALPRLFTPVVLGAMAVFAILGAFRLNQSLWDDEEYAIRRAVLGVYRVKDDVVKLRELSWTHTFWYYNKPTNHILQSFLARLSLTTWRSLARPTGLQINEAAVRFPSYLAGIAAVGTLGLLVGRLGFPRAGMLAAWLLALHPWHLRLAPEARGYGLVLMFVSLLGLTAIHALGTGRWRWWIALAAAEFGLLYTWPTSAMVVIVLNFCILWQILLRPELRGVRGIVAGRWLVSGAVAAMAVFQLLLPCIPQFIAYQQKTMGFAPLGYWLKNVGCSFLAGGLWSKSGLNPTPYVELYPQAMRHPFITGAAIAIAVTLLGLGLAVVLSRRSSRWMAVVFLLPGFLLMGAAALAREYLFEWYLAFMLPGLIALVSVGLSAVADWAGGKLHARALPAAAALALLLGFFLISHQPRAYLLTRPVQGYIASVLATRPNLDPNSPENRRIITASSMITPEIYDPRVRKAKTLEDYAALIAEAEDTGKELYVNNGFPAALKVTEPDLYNLLSDPAAFESLGTFYAIEQMLDRAVYRYRPGSLKGVDLSRYKVGSSEVEN